MSRDVAVVIGTVVGGYFGEPGLGYAIGSMVGNAYDPVQLTRQGPRLNDLKVQTSDYGKMIPILHGASRFAGNMIWATDIVETAHESESGGKGGGPVTTSTTYTYSQSFAIALCEGEVTGIGKIWANGKLIYNVSADATPATIIASQAMASSMRFHTGSETQTADSLIQAHVGAADTPAYRGTAYIVFENLQLANFGNRTPNMEFEVIQDGTVVETRTQYIAETDATLNPTNIAYDPVLNRIWSANFNTGKISITDLDSETSSVMDAPGATQAVIDLQSRVVMVAATSGGGGGVYDANTMRLKYSLPGFTIGAGAGIVLRSDGNVYSTDGFSAGDLLYSTVITFANNTPNRNPCTDGTHVWVGDATGIFELGAATYRKISTLPTNEMAYDSKRACLYCRSAGTVYKIELSTGQQITLFASAAILQNYSGKDDAICTSTTIYSAVDYSIIHTITGSSNISKCIWASPMYFGVLTTGYITRVLFTLGSVSPALSTIVSDICTRAGLTAGQIDVTQLTDTVDGYVTQRSSARVRIEQLMQAFYFDAVESDGKVKFVKRGGAAALTITEDDLAAHLYGGSVPENLITERKQEMELPVEVNVQYMDTAAAYQVNSQRSQRLITDSSNKMTLNFAISMNASKAKQISDVLMFDAWTARTSFSMAHSWKHSYLEPTDIIEVTKGGYTYNVRITDEDASAGVYSRAAVLDDASVYTQTANAAAPIAPSTTVSGAPLLNLMLLDIPLLRDQDDAVGFYAAACAYSGAWGGEQTFKSNDGGATWAQSGRAILNEATIGTASTALGNFASGNIFDESNSVTVVMTHGTLSSDTELNVLNGSNVALIGSEVVQFKTAALTATNTYVLTGLLRGRRGTEWAMSTHAVGDRFVLLSSTTTYIFDSSSSEYNLARKYRGVAIGGFLDDALDVDFTNTAIAQECYTPVQLGGGRNAANDLLLKWVRRTRIGGAWNDYADVPLGETTEAYVVEIYSSATYAALLRTISGLTAATTTYTAAQQTTDGLTPGNPVYFIVYQVSAVVGNGYGARGVV